MRSIAIALILVSTAALSDSVSTTFICRQPDGHKAAQDHPCDAGAEQTKTVDTVHHAPTLQEAMDDIALHGKTASRKIWCDYYRGNIDRNRDANRTELNKYAGNQQRQAVNNSSSYVAENCTPYGR